MEAKAERALNKVYNAKAYINDLLQNLENGTMKVETIDVAQLPEDLRGLSPAAREQEIAKRLAERRVVLRGDGLVDVAPPDAALAAGLADDELVLRGAAGVDAGRDDERAALGDLGVARGDRVLVEGRRREVPPHGARRGDPMGLEPDGTAPRRRRLINRHLQPPAFASASFRSPVRPRAQ